MNLDKLAKLMRGFLKDKRKKKKKYKSKEDINVRKSK